MNTIEKDLIDTALTEEEYTVVFTWEDARATILWAAYPETGETVDELRLNHLLHDNDWEYQLAEYMDPDGGQRMRAHLETHPLPMIGRVG